MHSRTFLTATPIAILLSTICHVMPMDVFSADLEQLSRANQTVQDVLAPSLLFNNCQPVSALPVFANQFDVEHQENLEFSNQLSELAQEEVEAALAEYGILNEYDNETPLPPNISVVLTVGPTDYSISASYSREMVDPATSKSVRMEVWSTDGGIGLGLRRYGVETEGNHRGDHGYVLYQLGKISRAFASAYVFRNNQKTCLGQRP